MAWFWNNKTKQKEEVTSVKRIGPKRFEFRLKNKCKHCGSKSREYELDGKDDIYIKKAISGYASECYHKSLIKAFDEIDKLGAEKALKVVVPRFNSKTAKYEKVERERKFILFNTKTLEYEYVNANKILDCYLKDILKVEYKK